MAASFFFYDLETSGFDPRGARIVQFGGQRTDMELNPIGEPIDVMIKLTPDVLPDPDAILVTGITPQQTITEGITEAEFLNLFYNEVVQADTIFVGFNSIRFDDEFMRFLHYRNFYDAYEWQWTNGCSRWDLLDMVRMTRALRPDGINWPFASNGKPANRLEFLTSVNHLDHKNAHNALNDVYATIAVAQLVRSKQKDLFEYLLANRDKKKVAALVEAGKPFAYTSGRYPSEQLHTTAAVLLAKHPQEGAALVYDLRHDPTPFLNMTTAEIVEAWRFTRNPAAVRLPVKTLKYNRCPAVAPLGVMSDAETQERLDLELATITKHLALLRPEQATFAKKVLEAVAQLNSERTKDQTALVDDELTVDARLYDGFISPQDKQVMGVVRAAKPEVLTSYVSKLSDARFKSLLPLYKARNYPNALNSEERAAWDNFCQRKLFEGGNSSRLAKYFARLQELAEGKLTAQHEYLLEELQLYGQSIMPAEAS